MKVAELEVSYLPTHDKSVKITGTVSAVSVLRDMWDDSLMSIQEQFCVLFLNNRNEVLGFRCLNTGTQTASMVDIKLLFSIACKVMAKSIIIAHNHPSGDLKESREDVELTIKIKSAADLLDIRLLDHIILTDVAYNSFMSQISN